MDKKLYSLTSLFSATVQVFGSSRTRGPAGGALVFRGIYDNGPEYFALGLSQKVQVATDMTL